MSKQLSPMQEKSPPETAVQAVAPMWIAAKKRLGPSPALSDIRDFLKQNPQAGKEAITGIGGRSAAERVAGDPAVTKKVRGGEALQPKDDGAGRPLPEAIRLYLEESFGESLADVRVVENARLTNELHGAGGLSTGRTIRLPGAMPHTPLDRPAMKLLSHEVAHVLQERKGGGGGSAVPNASASYEKEAAQAAEKVVEQQDPGLLGAAPGGPKSFAIALPFLALEAAALITILTDIAIGVTAGAVVVGGAVAIAESLEKSRVDAKSKAEPKAIPKTKEKTEEHRGRLQVQGDDMREELSWAWNRKQPPTKEEALLALEEMYLQCNRAEQKLREQAFQKARAFIMSQPGGVHAHLTRSFKNNALPPFFSDARVDIEVRTGVAFV